MAWSDEKEYVTLIGSQSQADNNNALSYVKNHRSGMGMLLEQISSSLPTSIIVKSLI